MNVFASMWGKFVCMYVCECVLMLLSTKTIVPYWTDKLSIVSTLRQCKYNVDDTVSTYLTVRDEGEMMLLEVLPPDHTTRIHFSIFLILRIAVLLQLPSCSLPSSHFQMAWIASLNSPFLHRTSTWNSYQENSSNQ